MDVGNDTHDHDWRMGGVSIFSPSSFLYIDLLHENSSRSSDSFFLAFLTHSFSMNPAMLFYSHSVTIQVFPDCVLTVEPTSCRYTACTPYIFPRHATKR